MQDESSEFLNEESEASSKYGKRLSQKPKKYPSRSSSRRNPTEAAEPTEPKRKRGRPPRNGRKSPEKSEKEAEDVLDDEQVENQVTAILDKEFDEESQQWVYLLEWAGVDPDGNPWQPTWEPVENLNCPKLLEEFENQLAEAKEKEAARHKAKKRKVSSTVDADTQKKTNKNDSSESKKRRGQSDSTKRSSPDRRNSTSSTSVAAKAKKEINISQTSTQSSSSGSNSRETDADIPWNHPTFKIQLAHMEGETETGKKIIKFLVSWQRVDGVEVRRWVGDSAKHRNPAAVIDFYEKRLRQEPMNK